MSPAWAAAGVKDGQRAEEMSGKYGGRHHVRELGASCVSPRPRNVQSLNMAIKNGDGNKPTVDLEKPLKYNEKVSLL